MHWLSTAHMPCMCRQGGALALLQTVFSSLFASPFFAAAMTDTSQAVETDLGQLEALEALLEELPGKLEKNVYDYETYTQWIGLLRAVGDTASLRVAREHMHSALAAPEDFWVEWIGDERCQPDSLHDVEKLKQIKHIFERAVREYMSVPMWQRYVSFVEELNGASDSDTRLAAAEAFGSIDFCTRVLQQAVGETCAHYQQSQEIWIKYKEHIERAIEASDEDKEELIDLLQTVFLERLGQPHAALEETFSLYSGFITRYKNDSYEEQMVHANRIFSNAKQQCSTRDHFEAELMESDECWSDYSAYIDRLRRSGSADSKEISTLYERALVKGYYSANIWDEYITYVCDVAKDDQTAMRVAGRAIRNCPWSGKLWAQIISLTFAQDGQQQALAVYARALTTHALEYSMAELAQAATAAVTITRLAFQHGSGTGASTLLSTCEGCLDAVYALPVETADPALRLEQCCTYAVADVLSSADAARTMWTRICKARKICTEAWVLSAEFERKYGSTASARGIYRHAAQRRLDNPARLFDVWLTFEHAYGDVASIRSAEDFINSQIGLIQRRAERDMQQNRAGDAEGSAAPSLNVLKRQRMPDQAGKPKTSAQADVLEAIAATGTTDASVTTNASPPRSKRAKHLHGSVASDSDSKQQASNNLVFVSNLPLSLGADELKELLGGPGSVESVAMLADNKGCFRGQATAKLTSVDALISALDKSGTRLNGHTMSVHVYKKHLSNSHSPGVSVRVVGFSPETTSTQIEQLAKQAGSVLRVHKNRQGDKVFVTMETQADALKAVELLDKHAGDGTTWRASITVHSKETGAATTRSHPAPAGEKTAQSPPLSAVSLVPRKAAARRPAKKMALAGHQARQPSPLTGASEPSKTQTDKPSAKSNDDFRQLFLGGK
ncbi:hypothetical protein GQ54DRAFT_81750 [Martensiomyces pterosporus]|nr:hypothetical protein GQ54DRAFT_81750 [Martensiomyces pterosporus]